METGKRFQLTHPITSNCKPYQTLGKGSTGTVRLIKENVGRELFYVDFDEGTRMVLLAGDIAPELEERD